MSDELKKLELVPATDQEEPLSGDNPHEIPGISIMEPGNPRSVFNIVSDSLKEAMKQIPAHYYGHGENYLRKMLKPNETVCRVRLNFWHEYQRAQENFTKMYNTNIARGVCSKEYLERYIFKDPKALGWILCPPASYQASMQESLNIGLMRLRQILSLPIKNREGKVDHKAADLILKAFALVDLRMKGSIVQRHEIKSETKSLNIHMDKKSTGDLMHQRDMEEVEERIKYLERKQQRLLALTEKEVGTQDMPGEEFVVAEAEKPRQD